MPSYESVDVVDLIRSATYNQLDLKIEDALSKRPRDFPGVVTCSPDDSLASILQYIRERRVHRFVIVEPGEWEPQPLTEEEEEMARTGHRPTKLAGRLVGMLSLSDILRHLVGYGKDELKGVEVPGLLDSPELLKTGELRTTTTTTTTTRRRGSEDTDEEDMAESIGALGLADQSTPTRLDTSSTKLDTVREGGSSSEQTPAATPGAETKPLPLFH